MKTITISWYSDGSISARTDDDTHITDYTMGQLKDISIRTDAAIEIGDWVTQKLMDMAANEYRGDE